MLCVAQLDLSHLALGVPVTASWQMLRMTDFNPRDASDW